MKKKHKVIERMDIVSRSKYDRSLLVRISYSNKKKELYPIDSYTNGKGIYLKKDLNSLELLIKRKLLFKYIHFNFDSSSLYDELSKYISANSVSTDIND